MQTDGSGSCGGQLAAFPRGAGRPRVWLLKQRSLCLCLSAEGQNEQPSSGLPPRDPGKGRHPFWMT